MNLAHYFPYDVKLRLLAHSRSFLANQKARNAIVGAENLLRADSVSPRTNTMASRDQFIAIRISGELYRVIETRFLTNQRVHFLK